jgi:hypothetical protein
VSSSIHSSPFLLLHVAEGEISGLLYINLSSVLPCCFIMQVKFLLISFVHSCAILTQTFFLTLFANCFSASSIFSIKNNGVLFQNFPSAVPLSVRIRFSPCRLLVHRDHCDYCEEHFRFGHFFIQHCCKECR